MSRVARKYVSEGRYSRYTVVVPQGSAGGRIVTVSSVAHTRGAVNFSDLNSNASYDASAAYAQSKLANILFVKKLARELQG